MINGVTVENYPASDKQAHSTKLEPGHLEPSGQRTLTHYNQHLITDADLKKQHQNYTNMQTEYLQKLNSATLNARKLEPARVASGGRQAATMSMSTNSQMNRNFVNHGMDATGGLHISGDPDIGSWSHAATFHNYKQHIKSQYQYQS